MYVVVKQEEGFIIKQLEMLSHVVVKQEVEALQRSYLNACASVISTSRMSRLLDKSDVIGP